MKREGRAALGVALAALALTGLPRLYLHLTAPAGQVFLGQVWGSYDLPRYVLLTRQAAADCPRATRSRSSFGK